MANRCKVIGCKKVSVDNTDVCKFHICRCNIRCCKVHDEKGKLIKDLKLRDGTIMTDSKTIKSDAEQKDGE